MSSTTAVASVTATLVRIVNAAIANIPGATAAVGRPDGTVTTRPPGVNIFLFQVTPNAALRNDDLPLRRSDGTLSLRPQAAVDLHYLFTFYGDETTYEPERLLGCVVSALHARPALARQDLTTTETAAPFTTFSPLGDLAGQSELVHFTQTVMNVEEISKLWSVFLQTPYVLSIVYQASVVLLETSDTPRQALPVLVANLYAIPFVNPIVTQVATPDGSPNCRRQHATRLRQQSSGRPRRGFDRRRTVRTGHCNANATHGAAPSRRRCRSARFTSRLLAADGNAADCASRLRIERRRFCRAADGDTRYGICLSRKHQRLADRAKRTAGVAIAQRHDRISAGCL